MPRIQDVRVPPENARILYERIAGGRLHVIADAVHVFPSPHPEEIVRAVTEFLRGAGTGAAPVAAEV